MARLTLESDGCSCPWSAIQQLLRRWRPDLVILCRTESRLTCRIPLTDQARPLPLLLELQDLLAHQEVHFTMDLKA